MAVKIFQLHKRASYEYKFIQDKYAVDTHTHTYAIADGTTQSFNSEIWAAQLTQKFVAQPAFESAKLLISFTQEATAFKKHDYTFSANPAKASLEREKLKQGATATFLGIQLIDSKTIRVTSVGDSNLFIINPDGTNAFPFETVEALDRNQFFLNTESLLSNETETKVFWQKDLSIQEDSKLVLATDALSRLFLKHPTFINDLVQLQDFDSFKAFCLAKWDGKELEEDDITAVVVYNIASKEVSEIVPPADFSFPKEQKSDFIPSFASNPSNLSQSSELTPIEMQQITNSVNHLGHEIYQVKQTTKSHQAILLILLGFVLLNTALFAYFIFVRPGASKQIAMNQTDIIAERDARISELEAEITQLKFVASNTTEDKEARVILTSDTAQTQVKAANTKERKSTVKKEIEVAAPGEDNKTSSKTTVKEQANTKTEEEKPTPQKIESGKPASSSETKE